MILTSIGLNALTLLRQGLDWVMLYKTKNYVTLLHNIFGQTFCRVSRGTAGIPFISFHLFTAQHQVTQFIK